MVEATKRDEEFYIWLDVVDVHRLHDRDNRLIRLRHVAFESTKTMDAWEMEKHIKELAKTTHTTAKGVIVKPIGVTCTDTGVVYQSYLAWFVTWEM